MVEIANAQRQGPAISSCEMYQIYIMTFHLKGKNEVTNNLCETLASMTNNTRIQFKEKQNRFNIFLPSNNQLFFWNRKIERTNIKYNGSKMHQGALFFHIFI